MKPAIFGLYLMLLYLLKKYGMMVDVLLEALKATDEYQKLAVDSLKLL